MFDFYHSSSDDPDEKMTREETEDIISGVSFDIKRYSGKAGDLTKKEINIHLQSKKKKERNCMREHQIIIKNTERH